MQGHRRRAAWMVMACALQAGAARADDAHYQNLVVGARAAGMGGAFTAVSDDSSGLMYNPAGIVDVKRANLSISSSYYGFTRRTRGGVFKDLPSLTNRPQVSTSDINVIPSAAGTVMGLGELLPDGAHRHAIGFSILVPDLQSSAQETRPDQGGDGLYTRSRFFERTLWAGAGYAYRVTTLLRLGFALHYVLRTLDVSDEYTFVGKDPRTGQAELQDVAANLQLQSGSLVPVVGLKATPFPHFSVGVAGTGQSLQLHHTGTFRVRKVNAGPDGVRFREDVTPISEGPGSNLGRVGSRTPFSLRAGVAYVETADWTAAADLTGYLPVSYDLVDQGAVNETDVPLATRIERRPILNGNLGFEKLLGPSISVSVGAFTNLSSAPAIQAGEDGTLGKKSSRLSQVHQVGNTFAVAYFSEHSLTRLGFVTTFGVGDEVAVKDRVSSIHSETPPRFERVRGSEWSFYLYVSTTFRYGAGRSERVLFGIPSPEEMKALGSSAFSR